VEATRGRHKDAVKWLIDNGANVSAYDERALRLAIVNDWQEGIHLLEPYVSLQASPQTVYSPIISDSKRRIIGYRENVSFPEFGVSTSALIDTGSDRSNIQAKNIVVHDDPVKGGKYLTFEVDGKSCKALIVSESFMCSIVGMTKCFNIKTTTIIGETSIEGVISVSSYITVIGRFTLWSTGFLIDPFRKNILEENIFNKDEPRPTVSLIESMTFPDLCLYGIDAHFDSGSPSNLLLVEEYKIIKEGNKQYVLFIVNHAKKKMVCKEPRFCKSGFSCETAIQETIEIVTFVVLDLPLNYQKCPC